MPEDGNDQENVCDRVSSKLLASVRTTAHTAHLHWVAEYLFCHNIFVDSESDAQTDQDVEWMCECLFVCVS